MEINAIITRTSKYNGTMFDVFEYFYRMWEIDKSIKLISLYPHINKDFLSIKYDVNLDCFKNIIIDEPLKYKFNKVLLFDILNIPKIEINAKKIFAICNTDASLQNKNVYYYSEFFKSRNYIHKLYFDIQRKCKNPEVRDKIYISSMEKNIMYFTLCKKYKNSLITKDIKSNFQSYDKTKNFYPDLYEKIKKFIYIKSGLNSDRHPRSFSECAYHNVECEYYFEGSDYSSNKDHSYDRFKDRFDIEKRDIRNDILITDFFS